MVISLTVLWQLFDCFIFDSFALFVPNPGIKHCMSPQCIFHVSSYLTSLCMYFPVKYYLGDCNENMLWLCRQNGASCRDRRRPLPSYLFLGLSQLPPHFAETTIKLFACATMSAFWFSCPFNVTRGSRTSKAGFNIMVVWILPITQCLETLK